jgi:hypothetical protein
MGLFGKTKQTLVVDMTAVQKSKGMRGNPAPRQQLQILRSLSRIVQREKVNMTAVIVGKPLNKAPNNRKFDGVRIRYVKTEDKLANALLKAVKQAGCAGVLVAENEEIEKKALKSGMDTLRVSTFRKLMDEHGDQGSSQNNGRDRNNGRNNGRKNNRDRSDRPDRKKQKQKQKPSKQETRNKEQDEISQMIDLVD